MSISWVSSVVYMQEMINKIRHKCKKTKFYGHDQLRFEMAKTKENVFKQWLDSFPNIVTFFQWLHIFLSYLPILAEKQTNKEIWDEYQVLGANPHLDTEGGISYEPTFAQQWAKPGTLYLCTSHIYRWFPIVL